MKEVCKMNTEKERIAIQHLKLFEPQTEPYYLCYSGGKDSDAIKILAHLANVKFEAVHCLTTVDAPETMQYIKSQSDVRIDKARYNDGTHKTMWNLIVKKKMPPTRLVRYCCAELKEWGGKYRVKITGVRKAESMKRAKNSGLIKIIGKPATVQKKADEIGATYQITNQSGLVMNDDNAESRRLVEQCYRTTSTMVNPIVDWTDEDVWQFLKHYGCNSNPLYECGYRRIGCVGCPMAAKHRYFEFARYPKYKANYIRAFDRMLLNMNEHKSWKTGKDVFKWWMGENANQLTFDDLDEMGAEYDYFWVNQ